MECLTLVSRANPMPWVIYSLVALCREGFVLVPPQWSVRLYLCFPGWRKFQVPERELILASALKGTTDEMFSLWVCVLSSFG